MTDLEKVIKGLTKCVAAGLEKACPADCPYFLQCFPDVGLATPFLSLMADALTLLKKHEPKPVRVDEDSVHCPSCGNELFTYPRQKFCDECGQELRWE